MSKGLTWLRWANLLLIFTTLAAYFSPHIHPGNGWVFSLLGLLYPLLLLGNLLFISFWLFRKHWYFVLSFGCILLGWNHCTSFVGFHGQVQVPNKMRSLRVATLNAYGLKDWREDTRYLEPQVLQTLLDQAKPDILCFQEFPRASLSKNKFAQFLKEEGGLEYIYRDDGSIYIFSRYPIHKKQGKFFANRSNGFQYADLDVDGQTLRIFNIHLQTNKVTRMANEVASDGNLQEKDTWSNVRGMLRRYHRAAKVRADQAELIAEEVSKSPHPVILCGDFNDVPLSYTYHQLTQQLQDGFKLRGNGLAATYTGPLPGLRIDYVLASPSFSVLDYQTGSFPYSDHRPVWCELGLPSR